MLAAQNSPATMHRGCAEAKARLTDAVMARPFGSHLFDLGEVLPKAWFGGLAAVAVQPGVKHVAVQRFSRRNGGGPVAAALIG